MNEEVWSLGEHEARELVKRYAKETHQSINFDLLSLEAQAAEVQAAVAWYLDDKGFDATVDVEGRRLS